MENFKDFIETNDLGKVETNKTFKELTTIGCGGKIMYLYYPKNVEALQMVFKHIIDNNIKYFVLGNGSNVLARDNLFDGVVIYLKELQYDFKVEGDILECSAFYPTIKLAYDLAYLDIGDLSFLGGIPGLLGGAIYNNSGAYNLDISKYLIDVKYIDSNGNVKVISNDDCVFGYRRSVFHYLDSIIISARFKVKKYYSLDLLEQRQKDRRLAQPLDSKNMGSIFKNLSLIPAWKVVDGLGMRGFQIGDAAISSKHANFIINLGNAKANDIRRLIDLIQKRAELELGIILKSEIKLV